MAGRDHTVQKVDAVESCAQAVGTFGIGCLNLSFCHGVGNADRGTAELLKETRESSGVSVEEARERQEAFALDVCATEAGDVSRDALTELIVKDTEAGVYDGLWSDCPGSTDARREICLIRKLGIVIPTQAAVDCKFGSELPIVLDEETVIVVANVNQIVLRCGSGLEGDQINTGIDRAKSVEIVYGGEELGKEIVWL